MAMMGRSFEWWMQPGEYWDGTGYVCHTEDFGSVKSTYCRPEPFITEKIWDWNLEHVAQSPVVWIVVSVLAFVISAVYVGLNRSMIVNHGCYGLWVFIGVVGAAAAPPLWWGMLLLGAAAAVWFGISWLTGKGGLAALRKRQAQAQALRGSLLHRAERWDRIVESLGDEDSDYKVAALEAAADLRKRAGEVKS